MNKIVIVFFLMILILVDGFKVTNMKIGWENKSILFKQIKLKEWIIVDNFYFVFFYINFDIIYVVICISLLV